MPGLLSALLLTLPLGLGLIGLGLRPRGVALAISLLNLVLALALLAGFDASLAGFQWIEYQPWIASLGVHYHVGVDGLSVLFLPATTLLFGGAVLASWNSVHTLPRLYYSLLLLLQTATLGVFIALDTLLFFLFWELTLVPIYFLVSLWGIGPNRRHAATKYTLVMLAGGVPLLFGLLLAAFGAADVITATAAVDANAAAASLPLFDLPQLLTITLPADTQRWVFLLLLLGFGVKLPFFPLHTWLPLMAMEGPAAIVALITGFKLGAFGLLRFTVPLAPAAAQQWQWLLLGLGVAAILYGATAALAQTNLRRTLAYLSLSHVGLVVLGIATFSLHGVQGAVLQLLNFAVASGGLFLLLGFLHHRTGSTDMASLGGAAQTLPLLASGFLLFGLAGMGMPGTAGFPAELLLLLSAFQHHAGAGLAALAGMVLGTAAFLQIFRRVFFGPATRPAVLEAQDLVPRERWLMLVFALLLLAFGLWPALLLDMIGPAAQAWVARIG